MSADAEVVRHGQQQAGAHEAVDAEDKGADGQERQAAGQPRQFRMRWMRNRQADCVAK
jgi:hypothetical protein